jgi:TatD family hydrolase
MRLIDTHAHFDASAAVREAWMQHAVAAGVDRLVAVGGSPELNATAVAAARAWPSQVKLALGWDRDQAGQPLEGGRSQLDADGVVHPVPRTPNPGSLASCLPPATLHVPPDLPLAAIGEIGLDYHYHPETREAQCRLFAEMLRLADERDLPVIIHTREADEDTLRVLDEAGSRARRGRGALGVVHCYTGGPEFARALLDRGLYLGFSGIVTFRNADMLRGVARLVPDDRLLLETDSPFLAPVPKRGQRNEPAFVAHVAELVAAVRGTRIEELAGQTCRNAEQLFGPWPL